MISGMKQRMLLKVLDFSTIKLSMELILDDWLEKIEREKKVAATKKALEDTAGKLRN